MSRTFASQADLQEKKVSFDGLSDSAYAYTAEGDPNTGIVIGDDAVLVADTQATPVMAQDVIRRIREVTDKPIEYVVLTHYHAVRVLGASGYRAQQIIASQDTCDPIVARGEQDMKSEIERFPRLFRAAESIPGLTFPTMTFKGEMTLWLGDLEVKLLQLGRGIGYHGRASSIAVSGQEFPRPLGQTQPPGAQSPVFGPTRRLDYELELGVFIGPGNATGTRIPMAEAESHVFGLCLLNDWSARDVQAWEYQPLGPFLAKNFATTISPWIVTLEALAPYRVPWTRPSDDPQPLAYLEWEDNRAAGAFDIQLEVLIQTDKMRAAGAPAARLSQTSFRHAYWTIAQMVAHHTVNGCNLCPGDLLGTGTESGPTPQEAGSLLELSGGGKSPLSLPGEEARTFLEDGDRVTMRGWCEKPGAARIGLGEVVGQVLPARP